ncbi:MAG: hypothetical protein WB809_05635 [Thermoplasmata archaeon]
MSENGPREGTRDLPRRSPEAGHRAVDPHSPTGIAYDRLARRQRRRLAEILGMVRSGLSFEVIVAQYGRDHPIERDVTEEEFRAAEGKDGSAPVGPVSRAR